MVALEHSKVLEKRCTDRSFGSFSVSDAAGKNVVLGDFQFGDGCGRFYRHRQTQLEERSHAWCCARVQHLRHRLPLPRRVQSAHAHDVPLVVLNNHPHLPGNREVGNSFFIFSAIIYFGKVK